ncbi:MAG: hypothetical protein MJY47_08445 [Fibrobacter sp.]|nr:hypothetical protein [Fibrobacter sp.]
MKKLFPIAFFSAALMFVACGDDSSSGPEEESSSSIEVEDESSSSVEEGKSSAKEEGKSSAADKKSSSSEAKKDDSSSSEKATSSSSEAVSSSSHYSTEPTCTTKTEGNVATAELTYYGTEIGDVRFVLVVDYDNFSMRMKGEGTFLMYNGCAGVSTEFEQVKSCSDEKRSFDAISTFSSIEAIEEYVGTLEYMENDVCEDILSIVNPTTGYLNSKMLDEDKYGLFRDTRDAMLYYTIEIGEQTWMAQNLNYESKSGSSCYKGNISYCHDYGRLYTWEVAKSACPDGWRLPTKADFVELVANVEPGFNETSGEFGNGFKLISKSVLDGTDEIGFSALLGGTYYGEYDYKDSQAYFWSQTAAEEGAYTLVISGYENNAIYDAATGDRRRSVRCIKDDAPSQSVSSN